MSTPITFYPASQAKFNIPPTVDRKGYDTARAYSEEKLKRGQALLGRVWVVDKRLYLLAGYTCLKTRIFINEQYCGDVPEDIDCEKPFTAKLLHSPAGETLIYFTQDKISGCTFVSENKLEVVENKKENGVVAG